MVKRLFEITDLTFMTGNVWKVLDISESEAQEAIGKTRNVNAQYLLVCEWLELFDDAMLVRVKVAVQRFNDNYTSSRLNQIACDNGFEDSFSLTAEEKALNYERTGDPFSSVRDA